MTDRELMQQAFERMTGVSGAWTNPAFMQSRNGFIQGWEAGASDLRERLAQPQRTHWEGCEEVHPECKQPEQSVAGYCKKIEELIAERDELRERLEQPEQEPVAWRYQDARGNYRYRGYVQGFDKEYSLLKPVPLYTRPNPQQGNRHG